MARTWTAPAPRARLMKTFLISPPFGSRIGFPGAERIMGSYTWEPRPGRLAQIARTVRPVPGGWVNAIGLRNPGLRAVTIRADRIYSLAGVEAGDWRRMADWLRQHDAPVRVELNLSCPNTHEYGIMLHEVTGFTGQVEVIAKLPPTEAAWPLADLCVAAGVGYLHFSNTLPSPVGGISGDALRRVNLPMVERAAKRYPVPIIAGGGIKTTEHVRQYAESGARHFSIATGCLHPIRTWRLIYGWRAVEMARRACVENTSEGQSDE